MVLLSTLSISNLWQQLELASELGSDRRTAAFRLTGLITLVLLM